MDFALSASVRVFVYLQYIVIVVAVSFLWSILGHFVLELPELKLEDLWLLLAPAGIVAGIA